jgi:hypothetical protein
MTAEWLVAAADNRASAPHAHITSVFQRCWCCMLAALHTVEAAVAAANASSACCPCLLSELGMNE